MSQSAANNLGFRSVPVTLTGPKLPCTGWARLSPVSLHLQQLLLPRDLPWCHVLMLDFVPGVAAEPWLVPAEQMASHAWAGGPGGAWPMCRGGNAG